MTLTVVLDGGGLHAWSRAVPPRQVLTLMELIRRRGSGRVIVPSVVAVEALGATPNPGVERALRELRVETSLSLDDARRAAKLRDGLRVSAADAVVAETVVRHRADVVVTSDPADLAALCRRGGVSPHVIVVGSG